PPAGKAAEAPVQKVGGKLRSADKAPTVNIFSQLFARLAESFKADAPQPTVQRVESSSKQQANAILSTIMLVAVMIIGVVAAYKFMPRKITPEQAFAKMPHGYRSAAGDKVLFLNDLTTCEFASGDKKVKFLWDQYLDDWRDALRAGMLATSQKQYWYVA